MHLFLRVFNNIGFDRSGPLKHVVGGDETKFGICRASASASPY
jgi:hypothetical protein